MRGVEGDMLWLLFALTFSNVFLKCTDSLYVGVPVLKIARDAKFSSISKCNAHPTNRNNHHDIQSIQGTTSQALKKSFISALKTFAVTYALSSSMSNRPAAAIGDLFELQDQSLVLQDITFNVEDVEKDISMFTNLFVKDCKVLRRFSNRNSGIEEAVLGFGPDAYRKSDSFYPGISDFKEYGGHATITLRSKRVSDDLAEVFEKGNGLEYIKIGAENVRLSKGVENGNNSHQSLM